jgi:hypothetical protein
MTLSYNRVPIAEWFSVQVVGPGRFAKRKVALQSITSNSELSMSKAEPY